MEIVIPDYINILLDKLEKNGFEAFIVGGSVRDSVLGKVPSDYDITTNALPEEMEEVFQDFKTILIGKEFGTIVVVQEEANTEITTYRIEEDYLDGRRPSSVCFSSDIVEDLKRRDFTINAMAYSKSCGLIDPFGGREDLKKKVIRTVGDPRERFLEDHLRILRCVRFSARLEFYIENDTLKACREMAHLLEKISAERIREELFRMLLSRDPSYGLRLLLDLNILEVIIPELIETVGFDQRNPHHEMDVFNHTLCVVDSVPPIIEIRLAALFHDIGKPSTFSLDDQGIGHFYGHQEVSRDMAEEILKRLRASNHTIEVVKILVKEHMTQHNDYSRKGLKRLINRVGEEKIDLLLDLQKADMICTSRGRDTRSIEARRLEIKEIIEFQEPVEKKQLDIDGNDIVKLGYKQGILIGEILDSLLELVLETPELNKKETLIEIIKEKDEYKEI
nr:HD domain-containing protein [Tissierella sp.]